MTPIPDLPAEGMCTGCGRKAAIVSGVLHPGDQGWSERWCRSCSQREDRRSLCEQTNGGPPAMSADEYVGRYREQINFGGLFTRDYGDEETNAWCDRVLDLVHGPSDVVEELMRRYRSPGQPPPHNNLDNPIVPRPLPPTSSVRVWAATPDEPASG